MNMADKEVEEPVVKARAVEEKEDGEISGTSSQKPISVPAPADSKTIEDEAPPLPDEEPPPLPDEPTPADDGWEPCWDAVKQAWYFYNRFTKLSQWENPRVPTATLIPAVAPSLTSVPHPDDPGTSSSVVLDYDEPKSKPGPAGGYNPAIHGDYDPNADYAQEGKEEEEDDGIPKTTDPNQIYAATGSFNRFTGKWQAAEVGPENHNDAAKSKRQMQAFFDVDAAANSHDGRSLKEERRNKKLTKQQVKEFNEKRRAKKEEKRRAWLKD